MPRNQDKLDVSEYNPKYIDECIHLPSLKLHSICIGAGYIYKSGVKTFKEKHSIDD